MNGSPQFDELLAACREAADWAIADLYRSIHPRLRRYLRAQAGQDADDLAADAWLDIAAGIGGFVGGEREFRAWAFTIARRRLLDHRRRRARSRTRPVPPDEIPEPRPAASAEAQALEGISTERALLTIASLPPDQAEVVLLGVLGGLGAAEIGRVLGKREGAVRVLRHRALKRLAAGIAVDVRNGGRVSEDV